MLKQTLRSSAYCFLRSLSVDVTISFDVSAYEFMEELSYREVCVSITAGSSERSLEVQLSSMNVTAAGNRKVDINTLAITRTKIMAPEIIIVFVLKVVPKPIQFQLEMTTYKLTWQWCLHLVCPKCV